MARVVAEKREAGVMRRQLRDILDLDQAAAVARRLIALDHLAHDLVQLAGSDLLRAVLEYLQRGFHRLENALLLGGTNE